MGVQHRVKSVTTCAFERQNVYTSDIPVVLDRTTCKRCWGNVVHDLPVSSWECAGLRRNHSPHRQRGPRLWQRHAVRLKRVARRAFRLDFVQSILAGFQVVILAAFCLQRMPHVIYFGIWVPAVFPISTFLKKKEEKKGLRARTYEFEVITVYNAPLRGSSAHWRPWCSHHRGTFLASTRCISPLFLA